MNCTPAYVCPRVADGVTSKADSWSLVVILFHLVCGRLPFGKLNNSMEMNNKVCQLEIKSKETLEMLYHYNPNYPKSRNNKVI